MRNRLMQPVLHVLVLMCLVFHAGWSYAGEVRVGDSLSLPSLKTLDGKIITSTNLRGKVVVVSYFASDCPFCMNEAPKLQKLYREYADKLIVIGVNIEHKEPDQRGKAAKWVEKYKLTYPITMDYLALENLLGTRKGLPVNYVFDKRGVLMRIDVGEIFDEDFDEIARIAQSN